MTARDRILARRAKMITAALATVALPAMTQCGSTANPQPCLFCAPQDCNPSDATVSDSGDATADAKLDASANTDAPDGG